MKTFWLSWEQPGEDSRPISCGDKVGSLLGWWESGFGDDYSTVVALVVAPTEDEAWNFIANQRGWPESEGAPRRFCNEVSAEWRPSDRFPIPKWSPVNK